MTDEPLGPLIGRRHGGEQGRKHASAGGDPRPFPNLFGAFAMRGYLTAFEASYRRNFEATRAEIEAVRRRDERRRKRAERQARADATMPEPKGPTPMLEDHGRRTGFDEGYRDASQNKRERPTPSLGASLLSAGYLDAYTQAYHAGYAQAERDIAAVRQAVVARQAQALLQQQGQEQAPDDRATALLRGRIVREKGSDRDR